MQTIMVLEKTSKHFSTFIELLKSKSEIKIKDVKRHIHHSSYYKIVIKKLYEFNKVLREINPRFYIAEPSFIMTSPKNIFTSLKRCEFIDIEIQENVFILRLNDETKK